MWDTDKQSSGAKVWNMIMSDNQGRRSCTTTSSMPSIARLADVKSTCIADSPDTIFASQLELLRQMFASKKVSTAARE